MGDTDRSYTSISVDQNEFRDPVSYGIFDPKDPPATLMCGHTFAISTLENLRAYDHQKCPTCGVEIPKNFEFKKNQILSSILSSLKQYHGCPYHPNRKAKFVCLSDQILLCDMCLCEDKHVGHKKKPLEEIMKELKKKSNSISENLKQIDSQVNELILLAEGEIKKILEEAEEKIRKLIQGDIEQLVQKINDWRQGSLETVQKINGFLDGSKPFSLMLYERVQKDNETLDLIQAKFKEGLNERIKRIYVSTGEPGDLDRCASSEQSLMKSIERLQRQMGQNLTATPTPPGDRRDVKECDEPKDGKMTDCPKEDYERIIEELIAKFKRNKSESEGVMDELKTKILKLEDGVQELYFENEKLKKEHKDMDEEVSSLRLALKACYDDKS